MRRAAECCRRDGYRARTFLRLLKSTHMHVGPRSSADGPPYINAALGQARLGNRHRPNSTTSCDAAKFPIALCAGAMSDAPRPRVTAGHGRDVNRAGCIVGGILACVVSGDAFAQDSVAKFYEGKTIELNVTTAAGSGIDFLARAVAAHMS